MLDLIRRDFILHRKFIVFLGAFYLIYLGYFGSRLNDLRILALFGPFLIVVFPISVFSRDDKFKSLAFGLSLPTTRAAFLGARYILSWALMAVVYAAGAALMSAFRGGRPGLSSAFELKIVLLTLTITALLFGFLMPLTVRFGWMGLIILLVCVQVLGVFALIFRSLLRLLKPAVTAVPHALDASLSSLGPVATSVIVLALAGFLTAASYGAAVALFRRMEF
jgi:hypothetical protein